MLYRKDKIRADEDRVLNDIANLNILLEAINPKAKEGDGLVFGRKDISNIPFQSSVYSQIRDRILKLFSFTDEEIFNDLKIFLRTTSINRILNFLPDWSFEWMLDYKSLDNPACVEKIDAFFNRTLTKPEKLTLNLQLKFFVSNVEVSHFVGNFNVGITDALYRGGGSKSQSSGTEDEPYELNPDIYNIPEDERNKKSWVQGLSRKQDRTNPNSSYGVSTNGNLVLKKVYNSEVLPMDDDKYDSPFGSLADDMMEERYSRKYEYKREKSVPFNSLFTSASDLRLFSKNMNANILGLQNIILTSEDGKLLTDKAFIQCDSDADKDKAVKWLSAHEARSILLIDGLKWLDNGKVYNERLLKRQMENIKRSVDLVHSSGGTFISEFDISAEMYDGNGNLLISQMGRLNVTYDEMKGYYIATVSRKEPMHIRQKAPQLELDLNGRLIDNDIVRKMQEPFKDEVLYSTTLSDEVESDKFSRDLIRFIKSVPKEFYKGGVDESKLYLCFMEGGADDLMSLDKMSLYNKSWKEFIDSMRDYEYLDYETEKVSFDITYTVLNKERRNRLVPVMAYRGYLTIELKEQYITKVGVELKAIKKEPSYVPKQYRYDLDNPIELYDDSDSPYTLSDRNDIEWVSDNPYHLSDDRPYIKGSTRPVTRSLNDMDRTTYVKDSPVSRWKTLDY